MSAAPLDGFVAPGFEPVQREFAALFDEGLEHGAGFAAIQNGETIVELWGGHADRARTKPWASDTLVPVYSTSKGVSALIAALLVQRGLLDYEAPVAAIWPEFAAAGKAGVTLAQMLSHQGGLCGFAEPIDPDVWLDPPALAAALAATAPIWPPGTASGYHPLTWGYLIGEVVRRASGESLGEILRADICQPHAIDFYIGLPETEDHRVADILRPKALPDLGPPNPARKAAFLTRWAQPNRSGPTWRRIEIPSANGHGTALALAQLYAAYAEDGKIGGADFLGDSAFDALTRSRIAGDDLVLPFRMDWAAGIVRNSNLFYGPNPNALGHSGWGGSCGLGDPARRLSAGYVMNRQSTSLMGDTRALRLIAALYACL